MSVAVLPKAFSAASPVPRLAPERAEDRAQVDALVEAAFGPGRYAKTAERLREGNQAVAEASITAWSGPDLAGAVRLWPITIGATPALFLGPIAVDARQRRNGLGARLVEQACEAATNAGARLVLLVGDRGFFEPLAFTPVEGGRVALPGPVAPGRILWRELAAGAAEGVGGPVRIAP